MRRLQVTPMDADLYQTMVDLEAKLQTEASEHPHGSQEWAWLMAKSEGVSLARDYARFSMGREIPEGLLHDG